MQNRTLFLFLLLASLLSACQKEIEVQLPNYNKKLVIEGYIENGEYPMVILTRSIANFNNFTIDTFLQKVLVQDAKVYVYSSKGEEELLTFQLDARSPLGFAYVGKTFKGAVGTNYRLEIEWQDNIYKAQTSILEPFSLDSIRLNTRGIEFDSNATLRVFFTDDKNKNDYYQFFVKVNAKRLRDRYWVTTIPVVFDDIPFNGLPFNLDIFRANPSQFLVMEMSQEEKAEYYSMTFKPGDTILLKYAKIDYQSYQYWSSASSEISFGQNPFMSPTPIRSNIEGKDVLGVWCGYAMKIDTLYY